MEDHLRRTVYTTPLVRACEKCTRNKRKCDKATPRCGRCERLNSQCNYDYQPTASSSPPASSDTVVLNDLAQLKALLVSTGINFHKALTLYFHTVHNVGNPDHKFDPICHFDLVGSGRLA
ncbi:hypothetical protein BX600DRAFT_468655 [Xylariales sp. PMI_506]|nr:hypothetical protein BX600DRAFT_468655 [Xylariales sp. PMI_506]